MNKRIRILLLIVILPLIAGTLIYIILSPETYIVRFLSRLIHHTETSTISSMPTLGKIIRNYVPDFLWAFSFMGGLFLTNIIDSQFRLIKCCLLTAFLCVLFEILQLLPLIHMTFDIWDVIVEIIAVVFSALIIKQIIKGKR